MSDIDKLVEALANAKKSIQPPKKNKVGKIQGTSRSGKDYEYEYRYADRADLIECYGKALAENGLQIVHAIVTDADKHMSLLTRLVHTSGQSIQSEAPIPSCADAKILGGWLTYLERYQSSALLDIASEEDTDGEGAVGSPQKGAQSFQPKGEPSKLDQLRIDIVRAADELAQREGGGFGKDLIEKYSAFGSGKDRKAITDVDKASEAWLLRTLDKIREQLLKTEPGREAGELFTETKK